MENKSISFNITNSTNGEIPVSILGNPANPMDNANATTRYNWDVTTLPFGSLDSISILYKGVFELSFSTAQLSFSLQTYQGVCDALNTLNLGVFFVTTSGGSTFINNYNENFVFGQLNIYNSATPQQIFYTFLTTSAGGNNNIFKNAVSQVSVANPIGVNGVINASNGDTINYIGTTPASSSFDIIVSSPSLPYNLYQIYAAGTNLPFFYSFVTSNLYDYSISIEPSLVPIINWQLFYDFNTSDAGGSNNFDVNAINVVSSPNPVISGNQGFAFNGGDLINFYGTTPSVAGYNVILTNFSTGIIEYQLNNAAANTAYSYSFAAALGNVYTASVSL
jgi:hypothetical protein